MAENPKIPKLTVLVGNGDDPHVQTVPMVDCNGTEYYMQRYRKIAPKRSERLAKQCPKADNPGIVDENKKYVHHRCVDTLIGKELFVHKNSPIPFGRRNNGILEKGSFLIPVTYGNARVYDYQDPKLGCVVS